MTVISEDPLVWRGPLEQVQISSEPIEHSVNIRIGDQWVDITELGDLLIKAGQDFNAAIGRDNG